MKEIKITIPDNCELIKEGNSYIIKEKDSKPRTWEEFCDNNSVISGESYITINSEIHEVSAGRRVLIGDKNLCTSKEEAEAFLALMQLRQLRKAWVGNWKQSSSSTTTAVILYSIDMQQVEAVSGNFWASNVLSFPTKEMAEEFLECFRELCEQAKSLL